MSLLSVEIRQLYYEIIFQNIDFKNLKYINK